LKTAANLEGVEEKTFYHGYLLEMRVHPCDALGQGKSPAFDFQATLMSSDTLIVTAPVLDFTDRGMDDEAVREYLEVAEGEYDLAEDEVTMEAFDNYRNTLDSRMEKTGTGNEEYKIDKEQSFPVKKQYKLIFINGSRSVHLSSEVLECHRKSKNLLKLEALPIEYDIEKMTPKPEDIELGDLETLTYKTQDNVGQVTTNTVYVLPQPTFVLQRFIIRLADLNQDVRKKGRIVKAADVDEAVAMMSALNKKKKKKKNRGAN